MKITIESIESGGFIFETDTDGRQTMPAIYALSKIGSPINRVLRIENVHTGEALAANFRLDQIEVDGQVYETYEELSAALTPILFKKGGGSGDGGTTNQENIIRIPSATYSDLGLTPESTNEEKQAAISDFLDGYDNGANDVLFFQIKDDPVYNFDITAKWETGFSTYPFPPVTDEATFREFLTARNATNIVITDFSLVNNRLRCILTADVTFFELYGIDITEFRSVGNLNGLTHLDLRYNLISDFDPVQPLPDSLEELYLDYNPNFNFNPSTPLPSNLKRLTLGNTSPVFNPSLPLPAGLETLELAQNSMVVFNPSVPLPNNLKTIILSYNQISEFNPSVPLPVSLEVIDLSFNKISNWSLMENFANSLHQAPTNNSVVNFVANTTTPEGTTFESILVSKGWIVY